MLFACISTATLQRRSDQSFSQEQHQNTRIRPKFGRKQKNPIISLRFEVQKSVYWRHRVDPSACSDHLFIETIYRYAMETNSHITIRYSCNDCDKYSLPLLHPISREIAKYAYEHSYLILGKDSDYFIYKNPGYIPFPSKGGICISRMLYNAQICTIRKSLLSTIQINLQPKD